HDGEDGEERVEPAEPEGEAGPHREVPQAGRGRHGQRAQCAPPEQLPGERGGRQDGRRAHLARPHELVRGDRGAHGTQAEQGVGSPTEAPCPGGFGSQCRGGHVVYSQRNQRAAIAMKITVHKSSTARSTQDGQLPLAAWSRAWVAAPNGVRPTIWRMAPGSTWSGT